MARATCGDAATLLLSSRNYGKQTRDAQDTRGLRAHVRGWCGQAAVLPQMDVTSACCPVAPGGGRALVTDRRHALIPEVRDTRWDDGALLLTGQHGDNGFWKRVCGTVGDDTRSSSRRRPRRKNGRQRGQGGWWGVQGACGQEEGERRRVTPPGPGPDVGPRGPRAPGLGLHTRRQRWKPRLRPDAGGPDPGGRPPTAVRGGGRASDAFAPRVRSPGFLSASFLHSELNFKPQGLNSVREVVTGLWGAGMGGV